MMLPNPTLSWLAKSRFFFISLLGLWVAPPAIAAPGNPEWHRYDFSQPHMGTLWTISCYSRELQRASNAVSAAFARVQELDRSMSDYDSESELNRILKQPADHPVRVSRDMAAILTAANRVSRASRGAFDVTAGPLIQVWRRARRQREMPTVERVVIAQSLLGYTNLAVNLNRREVTFRHPGMRLDLGGIAKGFAADAALNVLRTYGIRRAVVAASGDLAIGDPPPGQSGWPVRIGDPSGSNSLTGVRLLLKNVGVSTSGDTEQFVEIGGNRYSHIVDPHTGLGLTNRLQASVIAESATRSDAWATAVCILGLENGLKTIDADRRLSAVVLSREAGGYQIHRSRRFPWKERSSDVRREGREIHSNTTDAPSRGQAFAKE